MIHFKFRLYIISRLLRVSALMLWITPIIAYTQTLTNKVHVIDVPIKDSEQVNLAKYSLWLPPDVEEVKGIILHQHGCGRNGIDIPYDLQWRTLAEKYDMALMGSHLTPEERCDGWFAPKNGSERIFLKALETFADRTGKQEIISAPWLLWGHSGGAHWASTMMAYYPERVLGAFLRSGGNPDKRLGLEFEKWNNPEIKYNKKALQIPTVINIGIREREEFTRIWDVCHQIHQDWQKRKANAAFIIDPVSSHNCGNSRKIAIPFFESCIQKRLLGVNSGEAWQMAEIQQKDGVFTNLEFELLDAKPSADFNWLPDTALVDLFQEYATSGTVKDKTPPSAPTDLQLITQNDSLSLVWNAVADLESGIKAFNIYLEGKLTHTYIGQGEDSFQLPNYGDEPKHAYRDKQQGMSLTFLRVEKEFQKIGVSTINGDGMESSIVEIEYKEN